MCTNLLREKNEGKNNCRICIADTDVRRGVEWRDDAEWDESVPTAELSANAALIRRTVCQKTSRQKPTSSYRIQQRRQLKRQLRNCRHPKRPDSAAICHLIIKFHLIYEGHFEWPPVSVEASAQGDYNEIRMQFIIMQSRRGLSSTALSSHPLSFSCPYSCCVFFPSRYLLKLIRFIKRVACEIFLFSFQFSSRFACTVADKRPQYQQQQQACFMT